MDEKNTKINRKTRYKNLYFNFAITSSSFLDRAKKRLESFNKNQPSNLFYAALELRMGIEARLFEYIKASLNVRKGLPKTIRKAQAAQLHEKLLRIAPNSTEPVELGFVITFANHSNEGVHLRYTPVTEKLLEYHGKLGAILHFNFFENNEYWYFNKRLRQEHNTKSLLDYKDFIAEVLLELERVNEGTLLRPPIFFE